MLVRVRQRRGPVAAAPVSVAAGQTVPVLGIHSKLVSGAHRCQLCLLQLLFQHCGLQSSPQLPFLRHLGLPYITRICSQSIAFTPVERQERLNSDME